MFSTIGFHNHRFISTDCNYTIPSWPNKNSHHYLTATPNGGNKMSGMEGGKIGHLHDGVILLLRPEFFSFFLSHLILVIPERFK